MYGKEYAYASSRLSGTIVRLIKGNIPVVVIRVNDLNGSCLIRRLKATRGELVEHEYCNLSDLETRPARVGYVNSNGSVIYLQRFPIRSGPRNQGLNERNCRSSGVSLSKIPEQDLRRCIMGVYPSFTRSVTLSKSKKANGDTKTFAFSRHWAVSKGRILLYKSGKVVGSVDSQGRPILTEEYKYLNEYLREVTC